MDERTREYAVVSKTSGKLFKTFWANPVTADAKAKEEGYDLRKVNVVQIYP